MLISTIYNILTKSMFTYIHVIVLQRDLPSLDGHLERFVTKKVEKVVAKLESCIDMYHNCGNVYYNAKIEDCFLDRNHGNIISSAPIGNGDSGRWPFWDRQL